VNTKCLSTFFSHIQSHLH